MTQEERIELLKRVAEVAPKEMKAEYRDNMDWVAFHAHDCCWLNLHGQDLPDAEAIIAMLDAMEGAGYWTSLRTSARWGWYELWLSYERRDGTRHGRKQEHYGKTRAEAVARAFVEVFGK